MNLNFLAALAFAWWGFFPVYWKLLVAAPPQEIVLFRILFSFLFLFPFWLKRKGAIRLFHLLADRRLFFGLMASGILIGFNWFLYVWAVNNNRVVETSLGYFINPLVNVALGTLLLGERLRYLQKGACGLAALGVALLTWQTGSLPWISLLLAISFALYGLIRKLIEVPTISGTFWETAFLSLPALVYLFQLYQTSPIKALDQDLPFWLLLSLSGAITSVPLLAFARAAKELPLSLLGFYQFIAPSLQFLLGVFVFREPFTFTKWIAFLLIWLGLGLFLYDLAKIYRLKRNA